MTRFLIYLFESSLCLSLLYIGYYFLFRKESYFNFIRIYLLLSVVLALSIPIIRLNITFPNSNTLSQQVTNINEFKSYYEELIYLTDPDLASYPTEIDTQQHQLISGNKWINKFQLNTVLFYIYFGGLIIFLLRFGYLILWLNKTIKKNKVIKSDSHKLVLLEEEIAPFSFLQYIFINKNALKEIELKQILAHEITHIKQLHSIDLLVVHLIGILQWFNPIVWQLNKAFKTTHEYIADRKVVEQGYKLLDYQSLLLRQLISIRSVELVNNFNLLSIKKRIAMMNKNESGFFSKAKASIAIPIIAFSFFLIADLSCNIDKEDEINQEKITLTNDLPVLSQARLMSKEYPTIELMLSQTGLVYENEKTDLEELAEYLKNDPKINELKKDKKLTVILNIDKRCKMQEVDKIRRTLRENDLLKIVYKTKNSDNKLNSKEFRGLPQKLPPRDAKMISPDELRKEGISLMTLVTLDKSENFLNDKIELEEIINDSNKYVLCQEYNNKTRYIEFLEYTNMIYQVIQEKRELHSRSVYKKSYAELEIEQQKAVRKKYPITLTQKNIDEYSDI